MSLVGAVSLRSLCKDDCVPGWWTKLAREKMTQNEKRLKATCMGTGLEKVWRGRKSKRNEPRTERNITSLSPWQ